MVGIFGRLRVVAVVLLAIVLLSASSSLSTAGVPTGGAPLLSSPVMQVDVTGDDDNNEYLGRGGLLTPPGWLEGDQRSDAAQCPDCRWRQTAICRLEDGTVPDRPGAPGCVAVTAQCAGRVERVWLWRSTPATGDRWERYAMACRTGSPETTETAGERLVEEFLRSLEPPAPQSQPPSGAVTQLPVVFSAGGRSEQLRVETTLAGWPVQLRADPQWRWTFGDGAATTTTHPGGAWPQRAVAHTYRRSGLYNVEVEVSWPATFMVGGMGPFPIQETVRASATRTLRVSQARAVLVERF